MDLCTHHSLTSTGDQTRTFNTCKEGRATHPGPRITKGGHRVRRLCVLGKKKEHPQVKVELKKALKSKERNVWDAEVKTRVNKSHSRSLKRTFLSHGNQSVAPWICEEGF